MLEIIKNTFSGKWSEDQQRFFAWGFVIGFIVTMLGFGIGFILVSIM
jgi:uncharacterized membrane protein YfcA